MAVGHVLPGVTLKPCYRHALTVSVFCWGHTAPIAVSRPIRIGAASALCCMNF